MTERQGWGAVHGPSWRYNDARNKLSDAETRTLAALERGLVSADPRLARRLGRFGGRGRFARFVASTTFVLVSATLLVGLGMITPVLALAFSGPILVLVGSFVSWAFDGPTARRRRSRPIG